MNGRRCTPVTDLWDINANSCLEVFGCVNYFLTATTAISYQCNYIAAGPLWVNKDILFYSLNEMNEIPWHFTSQIFEFHSILAKLNRLVLWKDREIFKNYITAQWGLSANLPVVTQHDDHQQYPNYKDSIASLKRGSKSSLCSSDQSHAGRTEQKWFFFLWKTPLPSPL